MLVLLLVYSKPFVFSSHSVYQDNGQKHMLLKFYIQGTRKKGTVYVDMIEVRITFQNSKCSQLKMTEPKLNFIYNFTG